VRVPAPSRPHGIGGEKFDAANLQEPADIGCPCRGSSVLPGANLSRVDRTRFLAENGPAVIERAYVQLVESPKAESDSFKFRQADRLTPSYRVGWPAAGRGESKGI